MSLKYEPTSEQLHISVKWSTCFDLGGYLLSSLGWDSRVEFTCWEFRVGVKLR